MEDNAKRNRRRKTIIVASTEVLNEDGLNGLQNRKTLYFNEEMKEETESIISKSFSENL